MITIKRFEKTEGIAIKPSKIVKVKKMGNIVEVVHVDKTTTGFDQIQKISKTEYVDKETGEIHEYKLSVNKSENIASLKKTFRRARDLINNNYFGNRNELHITLTYDFCMRDYKKLYEHFKSFWKRYKYRYGENIDYLSIVEPQQSGSWHCHVLVRHNDVENIFIPNDEIEALWGHGFTTTRRTENVDNMGAYITAYLTDVELTEDNFKFHEIKDAEIKLVETEGKTKAYVKGARVHYYPSGMNIIRSSKGITYPEVEEMTYKNAKKIVGETTPNYSTTTTIYDDEKTLNQITYEHYNLKRSKDNRKH